MPRANHPAAAAARRVGRRAAQPLPRARCALVLVDVINPLDFDGAEALAPSALRAAPHIAALKRGLAARGVPALYVNDNFGHWHADFDRLIARCRAGRAAAARLAQQLAPGRGDITLVKPRHSGFYATPLQLLLTQMGTHELVVAGFATDLCVLLTAADAYERGHRLWVPADCCAAQSAARHDAALQWLHETLRACTTAAWPAAVSGDASTAASTRAPARRGMPFAERRQAPPPDPRK
ncbi:MAG: cysteine hydrolase [Betaproteobacteria bacterium]|jgi:nicotinamidase-related amidase|nr:cysteine hydrolase [Betaproteobacteria bacterium]MCC6247820.1 cysteine hydrolase [Rubrivivax sp.]